MITWSLQSSSLSYTCQYEHLHRCRRGHGNKDTFCRFVLEGGIRTLAPSLWAGVWESVCLRFLLCLCNPSINAMCSSVWLIFIDPSLDTLTVTVDSQEESLFSWSPASLQLKPLRPRRRSTVHRLKEHAVIGLFPKLSNRVYFLLSLCFCEFTTKMSEWTHLQLLSQDMLYCVLNIHHHKNKTVKAKLCFTDRRVWYVPLDRNEWAAQRLQFMLQWKVSVVSMVTTFDTNPRISTRKLKFKTLSIATIQSHYATKYEDVRDSC